MDSLFSLGVAFVGLLVVFAIMLRGPRGDRGNWHDPTSKLGRPEGDLLTWFMGGAALTTLLTMTSTDGSDTTAFAVGLAAGLAAPRVSTKPFKWAFEITGILAGVAALARFLAGAGPGFSAEDQAPTSALRLAVIAILLAGFVVGAIIGLVWGNRSERTFSLTGGRGLTFFGLVEVMLWLASPFGVDLTDLPASRLVTYAVAAFLVTVALGMAAGQFTLVVATLGLVGVEILVPIVGVAPIGPLVYFGVGFFVFAIMSSQFRRRATVSS